MDEACLPYLKIMEHGLVMSSDWAFTGVLALSGSMVPLYQRYETSIISSRSRSVVTYTPEGLDWLPKPCYTQLSSIKEGYYIDDMFLKSIILHGTLYVANNAIILSTSVTCLEMISSRPHSHGYDRSYLFWLYWNPSTMSGLWWTCTRHVLMIDVIHVCATYGIHQQEPLPMY